MPMVGHDDEGVEEIAILKMPIDERVGGVGQLVWGELGGAF